MIENARITATGLAFENNVLRGGLRIHTPEQDRMYFADFVNVDDVKQMLDVIGVEFWEGVKDSYVRINVNERNEVVGVGHILENKWHYISTQPSDDDVVSEVV